MLSRYTEFADALEVKAKYFYSNELLVSSSASFSFYILLQTKMVIGKRRVWLWLFTKALRIISDFMTYEKNVKKIFVYVSSHESCAIYI